MLAFLSFLSPLFSLSDSRIFRTEIYFSINTCASTHPHPVWLIVDADKFPVAKRPFFLSPLSRPDFYLRIDRMNAPASSYRFSPYDCLVFSFSLRPICQDGNPLFLRPFLRSSSLFPLLSLNLCFPEETPFLWSQLHSPPLQIFLPLPSRPFLPIIDPREWVEGSRGFPSSFFFPQRPPREEYRFPNVSFRPGGPHSSFPVRPSA